MRIGKYCTMFCLGGGGYVLLELLWRGRSHWSMFCLGGFCFLIIGFLSKRLQGLPLAVQLLLFSGVITLLELGTGLLFNRNYEIWDYRRAALHFRGQICLQYSLLWIPVSLAARELYRLAERGWVWLAESWQ